MLTKKEDGFRILTEKDYVNRGQVERILEIYISEMKDRGHYRLVYCKRRFEKKIFKIFLGSSQ